MAQERLEQSRECYLKGLHLLLDALSWGEDVRITLNRSAGGDVWFTALADEALPLQTQASLMQHYERTGQFAKAEDMLYGMIEVEPGNAGLLDFGISFYERLQGQSDDNLVVGDLPREEVETALEDLKAKRKLLRDE